MANNCYRATDSSSLPHHICSLFLCPSRRGISRTIQIVGHHRRFINDSVVIGSLIISAMTLNIITRLVIILPIHPFIICLMFNFPYFQSILQSSLFLPPVFTLVFSEDSSLKSLPESMLWVGFRVRVNIKMYTFVRDG